MAQVKWTSPALHQLEEILDFISLDEPEVARLLASEIFSAIDQLESHPYVGKPVKEVGLEAYRMLWLKPCWIYYRVSDETVYILHIRRAQSRFSLESLFD